MAFLRLLAVLACLSTLMAKINAQINPFFLFGTEFGEELLEFYGDNGRSYFLFNNLNRRLSALETNIRSGAIGGCKGISFPPLLNDTGESGLIGPFTPTSRTQSFTFENSFLLPPEVTFAVADLTSADAANVLQFTIRPTSITNTGGTVTITDANDNVASLTVAYFACPSNGSPAVTTTTTTG